MVDDSNSYRYGYLIVKRQIHNIITDMTISSDLADALNEEIINMLKKAEIRAKANGRRTVQARDL